MQQIGAEPVAHTEQDRCRVVPIEVLGIDQSRLLPWLALVNLLAVLARGLANWPRIAP